MNRPAAAFFDFDRTVVDGDAGVLFGRELLRIKRRRIRDDRRGTVGWAARNVRYEFETLALYGWATLLTLGTHSGLVKRSRLVVRAYRKLRGLPLEDLRGLANDYFDEVIAERIFPQARAAMQAHRDAGRRVVVVSTGMHVVIDPCKRHLPVDDVIAVTLRASGGVVTGEVTGPLWGQDKAEAVRAYAHARDLSLPRSFAYSDHHSDLHLLQAVGHPVVVNPTFRLRAHARARKWPIEAWRRDSERHGLDRPTPAV